MATNNEYFIYIQELLREVDGITYKKMMGEYVLYKDGIVFGGVYDDRFLIKKTKSSLELGLKEVIPYPTSKGLLLLDSEDPDEIEEIVKNIIKDLKSN